MMQPGAEIGRYRILEPLGRGASGSVYCAIDPAAGSEVALKVLEALPPRREEETWLRFRREVDLLSRLSHPNIVRVLGPMEEDRGLLFFPMERVDGEALSEILVREGPLPAHRALSIIDQLLSALEEAHARGIIHRDIKPSNVLVCADGLAVLTDFGIAQWREATRLTRDGSSPGTPHYMSPEQCEGLPADERSDLYSVGVVLYEMIEGRPPFSAESPLAILKMHVEQPPAVSDGVANPAVRAFLLRALEKIPENRFADAASMRKALADLISGSFVRPNAPTEAALRPTRSKKRVLAAAAVLILLVTGGLWKLLSSPAQASFLQIEIRLRDDTLVQGRLRSLDAEAFEVSADGVPSRRILRDDVIDFQIRR